MEEWSKIDGYPWYEVSTHGRVKSLRRNVIMKPYYNDVTGYADVKLWDGKKHKTRTIHRIVAETFMDFDNHRGLEVNHIDGNKHNNRLDNLEWCTRSENARHAIETGLFTPYKLPPYSWNGKRVRIIETGEEFDTITECANHIGGHKTAVSACLKGRVKSHLGYHFEEI